MSLRPTHAPTPRAPRPSLARVVACSALLVGLAGAAPRDALAHSLVTSAHGVATSPTGERVLTTAFGAALQSGHGTPATWVCPAQVGVSGEQFIEQVHYALGAFWLVGDGKVQRSTDQGCTWTTVALPKLAGLAQQLDSSAGVLWLHTAAADDGDSRVLRREGDAWVDADLPAGLQLGGLIAGPGAQRAWSVGTRGGKGVFVGTSDGGATWVERALPAQPLGDDQRFLPLVGHASQPQLQYVRVTSPTMVEVLLRSVDGGATWTTALKPPAGVDVSSAAWLPGAATGTLLVGSMVAGVYRSLDAGASFTKVAGAPRVGCLSVAGKQALACTDNFVWGASLMASDDDGLSWSPSFCFGSLTGPATCAASCAAGWAGVVDTYGIQQGTACGLPQVGVDAGGGGSDGGAATDAGGQRAPEGAGTGGGQVAAKRSDSGCTTRGHRAPSSGSLPLLLLALAAGAVLRRRELR